MPDPIAALERRLHLAHTARESREYLLDDIRTALVDIGWLQDDDPYGHGDLADVIRQNSPDRPGLTDTERIPDEQCATCLHPKQLHHATTYRSPCMATYNVGADICDCMAYKEAGTATALPCGYCGCIGDPGNCACDHDGAGSTASELEQLRMVVDRTRHEMEMHTGYVNPVRVIALLDPGETFGEKAAPLTGLAPCSINHDCPSQPRPEPTTARGEARCQSQHRPNGGALVQCALAVHPDDTHTDYDPGQTPPGWNPEPPWHTRHTWHDSPASDEVTPYDLHGPGRGGHAGCRKEEGRG